MRTSTAAGLVGAAMLSTLVFPFVGMALRKGAESGEARPTAGRGPLPARGGTRRPAEPGRLARWISFRRL